MGLSLRSARPRLMGDYGSGARADLALRIAELAAHDEAVARATKAQADLAMACREAEEEAEAAEAALCRAKFGVNIIAGLNGETDEAPLTAQEAREKKQAALDKHEAATAALTSLEQQMNDVWRRGALERRVKRAAAVVLRESKDVKEMSTRLDRLQRDFLTATGDFLFMVQANVIPNYNDDDVLSPMQTPEAKKAAYRAMILGSQRWSDWAPDANHHMGAERWKAALALLQQDANAALPEGVSS